MRYVWGAGEVWGGWRFFNRNSYEFRYDGDKRGGLRAGCPGHLGIFLAGVAGDEGLVDFEVWVEEDQVGVVAGVEFSEALEVEGLGLVPGGGFDELVEGEAGDFCDVAEAVVEAEGGAGEGAAVGEAGDVVFDGDFESAELGVAVSDP